MKPTRFKLAYILAALLMTSLACTCNALTGGEDTRELATEAPAPATEAGSGPEATEAGPSEVATKPPIGGGDAGGGAPDSEFPLPEDATNFFVIGEGQINFQTGMPVADVPDFYRQAFADAGYTERALLTVTSDQTISMVWDGHPSGQSIVVQAVDLGDGNTNVNIRLETVP